MCYYISHVKFPDDNFSHPEGPMIRVLTPVPFATLGSAWAALEALLSDLFDPDTHESAAEKEFFFSDEQVEQRAVWSEYPIILYNSHEPDQHVVFSNLPNSDDPRVKLIVDNLVSEEFDRLADARRVRDIQESADEFERAEFEALPASRFTLMALPAWSDIDIEHKVVAEKAVAHFFANPDDPMYRDPLTGEGSGVSAELAAEVLSEMRELKESQSRKLGDPSTLRVRGE